MPRSSAESTPSPPGPPWSPPARVVAHGEDLGGGDHPEAGLGEPGGPQHRLGGGRVGGVVEHEHQEA